LRVFLLTSATVDDIGGILVIAVFYSSHIHWPALFAAAGFAAFIKLLSKAGVRHGGAYFIVAVALWIAMFMSGIHPTIAGVVVGLLIPAHAVVGESQFPAAAETLLADYRKSHARGDSEASQAANEKLMALAHHTEPLSEKLQRVFSPWVNWVVLPVFALSNSGVELSSSLVKGVLFHPVGVGVFCGLLVGKFVGTLGFSWIAVKLKIAALPNAVKWIPITGTSILTGIGFTVSLFITQLAFTNEMLISTAKIAVLCASLTAAVLGFLFLRFAATARRSA
jgi:NhaA family Na+:H+ antiporter